MEVDTTILIVVAFVMAMAPAMALIWIFIAKAGIELFSSADTQAITEKVNPVLVPGTVSVPSSQAPSGCATKP